MWGKYQNFEKEGCNFRGKKGWGMGGRRSKNEENKEQEEKDRDEDRPGKT